MIETERLLLRKPVLEDAQPALALLTDPVAMEFLGGVHPEAATDPEFVVRRWLGLTRLISLIRHENVQSVRVAKRIGERYERDVVVRGHPTQLFAFGA